MTLSTSAIKVQDLDFSWSPEKPVLKSCSLEVPQGEFWMLLGNKRDLNWLLSTGHPCSCQAWPEQAPREFHP